jgi:NAD(P)-dependent dehydrogenase (short-subunit alcohol dehydrogenase family)
MLVKALTDPTARKFGHLDVLVNNAGIARSSNEVSNDVRLAYEEIITTNVIGTMAMTERFLPLLARSQQVKRVVFVSSGAGSMTHWATPSSPTRRFKAPAYAVSKSPVNALCLQYAVTYEADKSWKFNCCCPGYCSTNLNGYTGLNTPESGADIVCRLATLDYTGSSGTFRNSQGIIPW